MTNNRYTRQIILPEIGIEGQEKLRRASVLCVGTGGLGCPALIYLAAAGVGRIGIIDFDRVDESNLQRQILFSHTDIGKPKATQAATKLKTINPVIQIDAYDEELSAESAEHLFPQYDLILDGTDNFETKFLINDAAVKFEKPWVYGAIQGFEGQASVFNLEGGPCYRCLHPQKPKGTILNCAEAGIIGAVAGIIGMTQALQAIQIIIRHTSFELLSGRLWLLDMHNMQTRSLALSKNPSCPTCAKQPSSITLRYTSPVCNFVPEITVQQLNSLSGYILLDVREQQEWDQGHIDNATLWPLSWLLSNKIPEHLQEMDIVLYCQKGGRSLQAAHILKSLGFSDITNLSGGYESWLQGNN